MPYFNSGRGGDANAVMSEEEKAQYGVGRKKRPPPTDDKPSYLRRQRTFQKKVQNDLGDLKV